MLPEFFLVKAAVTVLLVVGTSIVAEKINIKTAGLIGGYPTGTAISLFFFGLEIGPQFASESVTYNLAGIIATQFFVYFYYRASSVFKKHTLVYSSVLSLAGYFLVVYLFSHLSLSLPLSALLVCLSVLLFIQLFRTVPEVSLPNKTNPGKTVLIGRGLFAALIIIAITEIAKWVGPEWAGLLSAFPTTIFPLILILHFTYGEKPLHAFLKHVPRGNIVLILYSVTVAFAYPFYGVITGTALAVFIVALVSVLASLVPKFRP